MLNNLARIFQIQKFLNSIHYPDSQRVAKEISDYLEINPTIDQDSIFNRLLLNEPWEYIKGSCLFLGSEFLVTKDTLIPRIETETLVNDSLVLIKKYKLKNIVDVGTGSGCISISISKQLNKEPLYSIYATDISTKALEIAKENEKNILKEEYIKWINTDLIEDVPELLQPTLIVANLPYIPTHQYETLNKSVLEYEPRIALDGGQTGLDLYEKLLKQIERKSLNIKAMYIETEESIYEETKDLLRNYFKTGNISEIEDTFGRKRFLLVEILN
jgi:release factor glutamine methyltransferase